MVSDEALTIYLLLSITLDTSITITFVVYCQQRAKLMFTVQLSEISTYAMLSLCPFPLLPTPLLCLSVYVY